MNEDSSGLEGVDSLKKKYVSEYVTWLPDLCSLHALEGLQGS